ncbi:DUF4142 domain-containing protein [Ramlibacter sp. MAHUQ-53]|uniref:DUF4142 domain-containing protein n=1 Tax=unclassified Ramlibacter TaxID=2617605 RepID=UPI0036348690
MNRRITRTFSAGVLALALGAAWAQSGYGSGTGATGAGSTGTGTGAGAAAPTPPAVQPGTGTRNTPKTDAKLSRGDRKFIEDAAASGQFEVQAAQLASTRATDPAVKALASKMADHHASANGELNQLANSLGLELPPAPKRAMRNEIEKLGKKTGADFDREFVREVGVKEHEKDIKAFQKAAKDVKDPQLKAWIDKQLPMLQQHLAAAQNLPQAGAKAADSARSGGATRSMGGPGGTGGGNGANRGGS